jgi:hypothetical protein
MQTIDLSGFIGTSAYHRSSLFSKMVHTDGVESFCNQAHAYWFLDICSTEIHPLLDKEFFLSIELDVFNHQEFGSRHAIIMVTDGDENHMLTKFIEFTDCPVGKYTFFMTDNVLMLTQEY